MLYITSGPQDIIVFNGYVRTCSSVSWRAKRSLMVFVPSGTVGLGRTYGWTKNAE